MRSSLRKLLVLALLGSAATVAAAHRAGNATQTRDSGCPHARAAAAAKAAKWLPTAKTAPAPVAGVGGGGIPGEGSFFGGSMRELLP